MDFVFRKSTKTNQKNYGSINARTRVDGKAKYYSLGLSIKESEWEKFKSKKWLPSNLLTSLGIKYGDFANLLAEIRNTPDEELNTKKVKKLVEKSICNSREVGDKDKHFLLNRGELLFSEYMLKYYEDLKSRKKLKKQESVPVSDGYLNNVNAARNSFLKYEEACEKHFLLCDIDSTFRRGYIKWMTDQGVKPNTINTRFSIIVTVMRNALENGLTKNDAFMRKGFVPAGEKVDAVYLTLPRLKDLVAFDMTYTNELKQRFEKVINSNRKKGEKSHVVDETTLKRLEISKDVFVVGCLTGQRISDFRRICKDMIVEYGNKKFITLIQQKGNKKVMIPLDKRVMAILEKYNGVLPKINANTFNEHLRIIAEVMGWTEKPQFEMGKNDGDKSVRFCDMVSSHTARRTFATIAYSKGVPLASIMAVTGHSSEEKLRIYLKLQAEEKAVIAAKDLDGFLRLKHNKGTNADPDAAINNEGEGNTNSTDS